jgi:hypothetical protein
MLQDTIDKVLSVLGITADVKITAFGSYTGIPTKTKGIYIIVEGDRVIYVGKGNIKARQVQHWNKAHNNITRNTKDTDGWRWLRENCNISPASWIIYYIPLKRSTEKTAVEGMLIHLLQPLANDETYSDRLLNLRNTRA